jgi:hypothetical protein
MEEMALEKIYLGKAPYGYIRNSTNYPYIILTISKIMEMDQHSKIKLHYICLIA